MDSIEQLDEFVDENITQVTTPGGVKWAKVAEAIKAAGRLGGESNAIVDFTTGEDVFDFTEE